MTIEPSDEAKRLLSPEELATLREGYADFEVAAAKPRKSNGMRREKTDFPIGIYEENSDSPSNLR